ncbi:hypothetical protein LguiA_035387 [Lonicera macranthoides]
MAGCSSIRGADWTSRDILYIARWCVTGPRCTLHRGRSHGLRRAREGGHLTQAPSSLSKTSDPRVQITGNFAPVPEQPVHYSLPVTGKYPNPLPAFTFVRGPNPISSPPPVTTSSTATA